jgi:hypothetical protein
MLGRGWISEVRRSWGRPASACANSACTLRGRRPRISRRAAGIHLQGAWYCSPQCFETAAQRQFARAQVAVSPTPPVRHRIPLGLLMLSRGQLNNGQLRRALEAQRANGGGRIGHWLERLGFATEQQVTAALGMQWACPVLPPAMARDGDCAGLLPSPLLQGFRLLPVHFGAASRVLHVAFSEGIDYTVLYAIEQMLECRTEACLINESAICRELERIGLSRRPGEMLFEGGRAAGEMARTTSGYALKLGARRVRLVACGDHVWVRLELENGNHDLWFGRPLPAQPDAGRPLAQAF